MKVALVGATGNAGSRILKELVDRGHQVTAIVRNPASVPEHANVVANAGDVNDGAQITQLVSGHDVAVSSLHFLAYDPHKLIAAIRAAGVRYIVVGGAGSLNMASGTRVIDSGNVPEAYKAESLAGVAYLDLLRSTTDLDWTFISPSAEFVPGKRTGVFRLGDDTLLQDASGRSSISYEDYAVALVDEIERPAHSRGRFTVGY